jgi:hypothetical protein
MVCECSVVLLVQLVAARQALPPVFILIIQSSSELVECCLLVAALMLTSSRPVFIDPYSRELFIMKVLYAYIGSSSVLSVGFVCT